MLTPSASNESLAEANKKRNNDNSIVAMDSNTRLANNPTPPIDSTIAPTSASTLQQPVPQQTIRNAPYYTQQQGFQQPQHKQYATIKPRKQSSRPILLPSSIPPTTNTTSSFAYRPIGPAKHGSFQKQRQIGSIPVQQQQQQINSRQKPQIVKVWKSSFAPRVKKFGHAMFYRPLTATSSTSSYGRRPSSSITLANASSAQSIGGSRRRSRLTKSSSDEDSDDSSSLGVDGDFEFADTLLSQPPPHAPISIPTTQERSLTQLPAFHQFIRLDPRLQQPMAREELLVPVKLDLEVRPGVHLRDAFTWNINDYTMTPLRYAEMLVFDLDLPRSMVDVIKKAIEGEIQLNSPVISAIQSDIMAILFDHVPASSGDLSVPVQIELQIGRRLIRDQFKWDLSPDNPVTPEQYARIFVSEHGLGGEYLSLISTTIREQIVRSCKAIQENLQPVETMPSLSSSYCGIVSGGVTTASTTTTTTTSGNKNNMLTGTMVIDKLTKQELVELSQRQDRQARRIRRETNRQLKHRSYYY